MTSDTNLAPDSVRNAHVGQQLFADDFDGRSDFRAHAQGPKLGLMCIAKHVVCMYVCVCHYYVINLSDFTVSLVHNVGLQRIEDTANRDIARQIFALNLVVYYSAVLGFYNSESFILGI